MRSGIRELENWVMDYVVIKPSVKLNFDAIAKFPLIFRNWIFNENKISELRNSKILSLFNNSKIIELRNSGI